MPDRVAEGEYSPSAPMEPVPRWVTMDESSDAKNRTPFLREVGSAATGTWEATAVFRSSRTSCLAWWLTQNPTASEPPHYTCFGNPTR